MDNQTENINSSTVPTVNAEAAVISAAKSSMGSKRVGPTQLTYVLTAILLSTILVVGTLIYTTNSLNTKLNSIGADISVIRTSLTAAPAIKNNEVAAQPNIKSSDSNFKVNLEGMTPRGDPNAPITIVEYSDFECPYCKAAQPTINQVLKDYAGKVKLYYKQFPLYQIHQNSWKAAEAALLAGDQGKFWEYHDILFQNQNSLTIDDLKKYAADLGLDTAKFNAGLDNGEKSAQVKAELQEGITNGVQGTPTFFINGQLVSGAQPYSAFKQVIDAQLSKLGIQ